ncbi:MAG: glycine--tRNA ligase subunit beta [Bryobacteraceae bacterium]|nr:glycine--tRNA ligase subunit beta [Bryobacteraceae bacterium]
MSLPFLLEIGVEEIPDWMIEPALQSMRELFTAVIEEHRLGGAVTATDATPRRLVIRAAGLLESQPDETRAVAGPPVSANQGAVAGFAKKMSVGLDALEKVQTPKGEYWSYNRHVEGKRTADVLAGALPSLITKITFPKAMYWTGKAGPRFIRPIRWLVALLGSEVVPFELAGVHSGNTTNGHRILGAANVAVTVDNFESQLEANGVTLSASVRRHRIASALAEDVIPDEALLNTLVYLTECPAAIRGAFDSSYLELPQEILTTVMRYHQRYFSVSAGEGKLKPEFVAVMNTSSDPDGLVQRGNERVLRARFNDARFFWNVDLKRQLGDRLEDLKNVTFQAKLGSYYEKTQRVITLAEQLATTLGADPALCKRAAELAKCDLPTDMVKELTELQGIVGGLYAREQGEAEEVWRAVYEHYKPVSMEDSVPSTLTGKVVALADKVDTLQGCFNIGLMPTGSRDPFALRRASQGVVKIVVEGNLRLSLSVLSASNPQLREFLLERTRYYFRDVHGFQYDEVSAVLAAGSDDLVDVKNRLDAIRAVRPTPDFEKLAASFKRIQNILRQAEFTPSKPLDGHLIEEGPEAELLAAMNETRERIQGATYRDALATIAAMRPTVDLFFDKVLVNVSDQNVRQNRLTLLSSLLSEFSTIADFSEIVVNTQ